MVICKYFLKGVCRFGESCKNEHAYTENTSSILLKKTDVDINILLRSASNDMIKAEKGNQWPLSCYGPFQGKPCFPGFEDKCFEEIRLGFYDAQRNGTLEQYKEQLTHLLQETRMKIKCLQNPTPEATNVLKDIYYSSGFSNQNSIFGNQNTYSNAQKDQNSIFGNKSDTSHLSSSVFGNQSKTNAASNFTFALPENKSIFGNNPSTVQPHQQPQSTVGNSIFSNNMNQSSFIANNQNIFGTSATNQPVQNFNTNPVFNSPTSIPPNQVMPSINHTQNIFGNLIPVAVPMNNPPSFGAGAYNIQNNQIYVPSFTGNEEIKTNTGPFYNTVDRNIPANIQPSFNNIETKSVQAHSTSIFGNNYSQRKSIETNVIRNDDATIYSQVENLNDTEVSHFQAACFEFGKIPSKAPPLQMC